MTYTFIAAIADGRLGGADYREWTQRQLADHNLHLAGNELKLGDDLIGFYAFLDRDQGGAADGDRGGARTRRRGSTQR